MLIDILSTQLFYFIQPCFIYRCGLIADTAGLYLRVIYFNELTERKTDQENMEYMMVITGSHNREGQVLFIYLFIHSFVCFPSYFLWEKTTHCWRP